MTDPNQTIVEFLAARLDEDGRGVKDCPGDPYCPCPLAHDDAAEADIAAKRRIVSWLDMGGRAVSDPEASLANDVLRELASVYSDHPDYQQEWAMEPPAEPAPDRTLRDLSRPTDGNTI